MFEEYLAMENVQVITVQMLLFKLSDSCYVFCEYVPGPADYVGDHQPSHLHSVHWVHFKGLQDDFVVSVIGA